MKIKIFTTTYKQGYYSYRKESDRIQALIDKKKEQIVRLEKKRNKLDHPSWIETIIEPIAKELIRHFPRRHYDVLGPLGLCARTSIHFYKNGVPDNKKCEGDNCLSITFTPDGLHEECQTTLSVTDYSKNTGRYPVGSIGEINGMNYPRIPIDDNLEVEELLKYIDK